MEFTKKRILMKSLKTFLVIEAEVCYNVRKYHR